MKVIVATMFLITKINFHFNFFLAAINVVTDACFRGEMLTLVAEGKKLSVSSQLAVPVSWKVVVDYSRRKYLLTLTKRNKREN